MPHFRAFEVGKKERKENIFDLSSSPTFGLYFCVVDEVAVADREVKRKLR